MLIIPFVLNLVNLKVTGDLKYWVYILTLLARLSTKDFYPIIVDEGAARITSYA